MYCAKLTLIDRRVRGAKPKHGGAAFKRNCLMKEMEISQGTGGASKSSSNHRKSRSRYSSHDDDDERGHFDGEKEGRFSFEDDDDDDDDNLSSLSTGDSHQTEITATTTTRQTLTMPHPKTPLVVTTLDMPDDLKGYQTQHMFTKDASRIFRIPHNYQQYQQTLLSRSFSTFTKSDPQNCDKMQTPPLSTSICVRGEKIEGQSKPLRAEKNGGVVVGDASKNLKDDDNYHMMNARGETSINFYDFQRTWSIEDYVNDESDDDEEEAASQLNLRGTCRRKSHCSNSGLNPRYDFNTKNGRRIRAPSPKTKQIIRVNVKVANS